MAVLLKEVQIDTWTLDTMEVGWKSSLVKILIFFVQAKMVEDSWAIEDLESEKISKDVSQDLNNQESQQVACQEDRTPWTGQRWSKYAGETSACKELSHEQGEERKNVWSGQTWNKYV